MLEEKNLEALVNANFICQGPGSSGGTGKGQYGWYQVLGNEFRMHEGVQILTQGNMNLAFFDFRYK